MDLLPCPFCSSAAKIVGIRDGARAKCTKCFADGPPIFHGPGGWEQVKLDVATAWNRRAEADFIGAYMWDPHCYRQLDLELVERMAEAGWNANPGRPAALTWACRESALMRKEAYELRQMMQAALRVVHAALAAWDGRKTDEGVKS